MKVIRYTLPREGSTRLGVLLASIGMRKGKHMSRVISTGDLNMSRIPSRNILPDRPVLIKGENIEPDTMKALKAAHKQMRLSLDLRSRAGDDKKISKAKVACKKVARYIKSMKEEVTQ